MRFKLPDSRLECSGWIDEDKAILKKHRSLSIKDKVFYLKNRFHIVFFGPMDTCFLRSAPYHRRVNSKDFSFFLLGTTLICCAMEAVGAFMLGGKERPSPGENKRRFVKFLQHYMKSWNKSTAGGTHIPNWMWNNLRNSLAHSMTISRGGMADLGKKRFNEVRHGVVTIHAESLYRDFRRGFSAYLRDVERKTSLKRNFERRFKYSLVDVHS